MCNQPDKSLIGQCEHNRSKGFLSHRLIWTQNNPRVHLGVIYYDIKKILLTNLSILSKNLHLGLSSILIHSERLFFRIISHTFINVKWKIMLLKYMLPVTTFSKPKLFCNKPTAVLSSLYVHLIQCVKLLLNTLKQTSKNYLEWSWYLM